MSRVRGPSGLDNRIWPRLGLHGLNRSSQGTFLQCSHRFWWFPPLRATQTHSRSRVSTPTCTFGPVLGLFWAWAPGFVIGFGGRKVTKASALQFQKGQFFRKQSYRAAVAELGVGSPTWEPFGGKDMDISTTNFGNAISKRWAAWVGSGLTWDRDSTCARNVPRNSPIGPGHGSFGTWKGSHLWGLSRRWLPPT